VTFDDFSLAPALSRAISELGYTEPTPIQARAIPIVLEGRDLLAAAQTGTGKTAAFVLPLLQRLSLDVPEPRGPRAPRALILVPTRELAAQCGETLVALGRHLQQRATLILGGVSPRPQVEALARGVDIVVATPGRLLDHAKERNIDLSRINYLVLDEADRMLDMGFIRDIRRVLALLPKQRQNLLFSATFSDEIRALANGLLRDPASIDIAPRNTPVELVDHRVYRVDPGRKLALLVHILQRVEQRQTLVFARTKHGANRLAEQLQRAGIDSAAIHGNKSQNARTKALADFKAGRVAVLVATDIAARGLDIEGLPQVINHELPHVPEDYVHRIGRTGRAGRNGEALSLVSRDEQDRLRAIERMLGKPIPVLETPSLPDLPATVESRPPRAEAPRSPAPSQQARAHGGRGAPSGARGPSAPQAHGSHRGAPAGVGKGQGSRGGPRGTSSGGGNRAAGGPQAQGHARGNGGGRDGRGGNAGGGTRYGRIG
jgi:ATP-dependent RNA helicase RhlE